MKELKGISIPTLGFIPQKIGDLIYFEGPLLSLFLDRNNPDTYYLYKWADCNETINRWLVIQLNSVSLRSFFFKEISLRNLLLNSPLSYVLGIDDTLIEKEIIVCATTDLPEIYLPKENSFFSEEKYTDFASTFKTIIVNSRIYDILNEILKKVSVVEKKQNDTDTILRAVLSIKRLETTLYSDSILYSKQAFNYEQILN